MKDTATDVCVVSSYNLQLLNLCCFRGNVAARQLQVPRAQDKFFTLNVDGSRPI